MGAEVIIGLIVKYGIPLAEKIYTVVTTHGVPSPAMWAELKALNEEWTMARYLEEAQGKVKAGIESPPSS